MFTVPSMKIITIKTNLDKLQVGESSDVEVGCVLLRGDAVVELAVAAAD